jgi:hypothetical protein
MLIRHSNGKFAQEAEEKNAAETALHNIQFEFVV